MKDKVVKILLSLCLVTGLTSCVYWIGYGSGNRDVQKKYHLISDFGLPIEKENIISISDTQGLRDIIEVGELKTGGKFHNGIDFSCLDKTPVLATKSGKVINCYPSFYNGKKWKGHNVYGGVIVIQHYDGTISLYAHLSRTDVVEGQTVVKGQQIGLSGGVKGRRGSGISTGCHLHYAVYMNIEELMSENF